MSFGLFNLWTYWIKRTIRESNEYLLQKGLLKAAYICYKYVQDKQRQAVSNRP